MTQIADDPHAFLAQLGAQEWWQGSVIHKREISEFVASYVECDWWIVATQACNIYSDDLKGVPVVELIGASEIQVLSDCSTGSHPRMIDLSASRGGVSLLLKAESQKRVWIPRTRLAEISSPSYRLENMHTQPYSSQSLWLDKFSSWLARGYTRAALPNAFNQALAKSKIRDILEARLAKKKHDELYGIFLTITSGSENGEFADKEMGLLAPPYDLGILVACNENVDSVPLHAQLIKQLFGDEIKDPENEHDTITRASLAKRLGIRILKDDIEVRAVSEIYLAELLGKNTIRYNLVDFHSVSNTASV